VKNHFTVGVVLNSLTIAEGYVAGGTVRTLAILDQWCIERRFALVIFAPRFAYEYLQERLPMARVVTMPELNVLRDSRAFTYLGRALVAWKRSAELNACDALFASSPFLPDAVTLVVARRPWRVVLIAHILPAPWRRPGPTLRNAVAYVAENIGLTICRFRADAFVTLSNLVALDLRRRGLRQMCFVSTNGVEHVGTPTESQVRSGVVCVARLHPAKGISDLIEAWPLVTARVPDAVLTLAGSGDDQYTAQLHAAVDAARLAGRVIFAGPVDDPTRDELLRSRRAFVLASYEEGWSIATAEAMRCGLPCVTYDLPIFEEIFPAGRLVAPLGDVRLLAERVIELLTDDALFERLAAAARELAGSLTWSRAAEIDARALVRPRIMAPEDNSVVLRLLRFAAGRRYL